jgi:hypothetical protein
VNTSISFDLIIKRRFDVHHRLRTDWPSDDCIRTIGEEKEEAEEIDAIPRRERKTLAKPQREREM